MTDSFVKNEPYEKLNLKRAIPSQINFGPREYGIGYKGNKFNKKE